MFRLLQADNFFLFIGAKMIISFCLLSLNMVLSSSAVCCSIVSPPPLSCCLIPISCVSNIGSVLFFIVGVFFVFVCNVLWCSCVAFS